MSRYMRLADFRKRYEVVNAHDLAAEEPKKYYDPWAERE